ncbi:MAG: DUF3795 domain-containing protein [Candidatus Lokiarchaeia archaeon]|nr:DUF3795 domain-containing protein [Candidatus Lokiarchaeia archaeon]
MSEDKEKMIGFCGYNCFLCAARSDDIKLREKLVNAWRKYLGHEMYTAENVACDGCKSKGNKIADKNCQARPCAREKGFESCAECNEFPCNKVKNLLGSSISMLTYGVGRFKDITQEEFDLAIQQWNSMPNLLKILVDEGRLPSFILHKI